VNKSYLFIFQLFMCLSPEKISFSEENINFFEKNLAFIEKIMYI